MAKERILRSKDTIQFEASLKNSFDPLSYIRMHVSENSSLYAIDTLGGRRSWPIM